MKDMSVRKMKGWALAAVCALAAAVCPAQERDVELRVVHTNDTHSCIMPISPHSSDTALADKGGMVRRAALLRNLRAEDADLLLFDSGDFSQGSAYYNLYKGEVEVRLMNEMRYDAATIGNHEFDFGMDNMARIFRMADFPIVCANYHFEGTVLEGLVQPYVVLERKGLRIGVFGLGTQLEGMVAEDNYKGVVYEDPIAAANRVTDILKNKEHCDLIVCLSHLGWDIEGVDDTEVIPASHGMDLVLGGHSHSYFEHPEVVKDADGRNVYCNQMGKHGRYVGILDLDMRPLDRSGDHSK